MLDTTPSHFDEYLHSSALALQTLNTSLRSSSAAALAQIISLYVLFLTCAHTHSHFSVPVPPSLAQSQWLIALLCPFPSSPSSSWLFVFKCITIYLTFCLIFLFINRCTFIFPRMLICSLPRPRTSMWRWNGSLPAGVSPVFVSSQSVKHSSTKQ